MSILDQLNARLAVKKQEPESALMQVAKAAAEYANNQVNILKWTPEAEAKIKAMRDAHLAANPTSHADSIPRGKREESAHQKNLDSENWHTKTMASFKDKSNDSLKFIRQDAHEAERANPTGHKAGQYLDEVHYASGELNARQKHFAGKK